MNGIAGKYVVVTRTWRQSVAFFSKLEIRKAIPLIYPCIEISPPSDTENLDIRIAELFEGSFDWLILTSQNAVDAIAARRKKLQIYSPIPAQVKIAAVGPKTAAAAIELLEVSPIAVPSRFNSQALAEKMAFTPGQSVFLPQSRLARDELAETFIRAGAKAVAVEAYQTTIGTGGVSLVEHLDAGKVDAITFASPSAAHFFMERLLNEGGKIDSLQGVCIACIGTTTQKAASEMGLKVSVVPKMQTIDGLIDALQNHFLLNS